MTSRRDFVKTLAASGVAIAASDLMADLIAQSPKGRVLESKFKGPVSYTHLTLPTNREV